MKTFCIIGLFITVAAIGFSCQRSSRCNDRGGVIVKSAFEYVCVKLERIPQ